MTEVAITHIGGPTVLLEFGGWRLLTDPTFDPAGERWNFGWGALSQKLTGPAVAASALGHIDAVLISHDQHGDNLDHAGRALLPHVDTVVTTAPGARRLGANAVGLTPWQTTTLAAPDRAPVTITATPARHGPPGSRPIVGTVVGFLLQWDAQEHGALWISGDTVLFEGVRELARRYTVGTAVVHLGGVRFPITGPLRYTMTAEAALEACGLLKPHRVVPVHYEGWKHFRQPREEARRVFDASPIASSVTWLQLGAPTTIDI